MKQRAGLVYWPDLNNDIVSSCRQCQDYLPFNAKEPIIFKARPTRPFQEVAADLCYHAGRHYLVIIDCYSDWLTIAPMGTEVTSLNVVSAFRALFSQTAISDVLWSDGRPQFTAKYFQSFADRWGFFHHKSTPHYPQGNGQAESAVKSTKSGMKRQKFRWGETQQSPPPISQHSMSKRCFITCPKAVWVTGSTADHLLHNGSILQKMQNSRQQV